MRMHSPSNSQTESSSPSIDHLIHLRFRRLRRIAKRGTRPSVTKKFQCTPYSVTCSGYSVPLTMTTRINPSARTGAALRKDVHISSIGPIRPPFVIDLKLTMPREKTKLPTPMSITLVPNVSHLPRARGKTGKSTARMQWMVMTIMCAR